MRIFLTIPDFSRNGGIRVILEWANRLSARGHQVLLRPVGHLRKWHCEWFSIAPEVELTMSDNALPTCDALIVTSPHSLKWLYLPGPRRKVIFLQMMEHLFRPTDKSWQRQCAEFYRHPAPLITISQWGIQSLQNEWKRTGPIYYVGNGVNLEHFPIAAPNKDKRIALVEGWQPSNPTKDYNRFGLYVAKELKRRGYTVWAYSNRPAVAPYATVADEFVACPSLKEMNEFYTKATILVKASKLDFRACAPMEAMTKGTVTARAVNLGDDDLVDGENCLRGPYNETILLHNALRLLEDDQLRGRLAQACQAHVQRYSWDYWMEEIEKVLWA